MRVRTRIAIVTLLGAATAAALVGCGEEWRPVTTVEKLRLLGIRAEPPDLQPGQSTRLSALLLDPREPSRANTLLWLACDPDPDALDQPQCAKFATLDDAAELADASAMPEGMRVLIPGPGDTPYLEATYQAPADLFAKLAPSDPRRARGVLAYVLAMAIAAPPPTTFPPSEEEMKALLARVQAKEVDSVIALKRIRVSEDPARNANPRLAGVRIDGELWTEGLRPVKLRPGQTYPIVAEAADGSSERYVQLDPDGKPVEKDEKLSTSWFSTYGLFEAARTPAGQELQEFSIPTPFDHLPADGRATMYVVLRDGRGGTDWLKRGLVVCDPFLDAPTITTVEPRSAPPGAVVTIRGTGLRDVIDVRAGTGWLSGVRYDTANDVLTGALPSDAPAGAMKLTLRGRSCRPDPDYTLEIEGT